jgi:CubicO group peptidase (beta-lactamase class C family)
VDPWESSAADVRQIVRSHRLDAAAGALSARAADGTSVLLALDEQVVDGSVTTGTLMYAASIAKQVIGVLLSQQVEAGALDEGRTLNSYVEDLPAWAGQIRVRHLIHHTSGLPPTRSPAEAADNHKVLAFLRGCQGLTTQPGSTYVYSNVGYIFLAEILNRLTGSSVEHLAHSTLFTPLGMAGTTLGSQLPITRSGHTQPPATVGDGGLWTTAEDLLRWNDAMNAHHFGRAVHVRAETPGTLTDGTPLDYAWGIRVIDHRGRRTLSHGGSWPTWSAKTIRQPDQGISVAILTASEDAEAVTSLALAAAEALG